jgi:hypothetical protein
MCWRQQKDLGIRYLPSSSIDVNIISSLDWLYRDKIYNGGAWLQRFAWILFTFLEQMPELEDIVLDMPPGVFGFTREVLSLLAHLVTGGERPEGYPDLPGHADRKYQTFRTVRWAYTRGLASVESIATMFDFEVDDTHSQHHSLSGVAAAAILIPAAPCGSAASSGSSAGVVSEQR